jgi:dipeptidyl aminopeptidase/acylaminoacyl peptidase
MTETPTTLTAEMITDALIPAEPQLSPDGHFVAYTVAPLGRRDEHRRSAIWLAAADGASAPRRLTAGTAQDRLPKWSLDSDHLYFLSDRAERGKPQLHHLPLGGGEAEALTAWKGKLEDYAPLPGCRQVALLATDPPTEEEERRERERDDADVYGERWPRARLRLLDLATREIGTVAGLDEQHVALISPSLAGDQLALVTWPTPELDDHANPGTLWVVTLDGATLRRVGDAPAGTRQLAWTADGRGLVALASAIPGGVSGTALFAIALSDGAARRLTDDLPGCPSGLVGTSSGLPLVTIGLGLDSTLNRLDPATGQLSELLRERGDLAMLTASADGTVVAGLHSTPRDGFNVWAGPPGGPLARLTDLRPELRAIPLGQQERLAWQAGDGLALDGLLILPPGKTRADGPFPLVTIVHGGPYSRFADGLQLNWQPSGQWLATAGYAVLLPNPRGGMGHGQQFAACVAGRVGLEDWGDIVAGIDRLVADGVADPDRLGIGGWSQGGFMTAWAVGQTDRFKAGVMGAGVSDWGMMVAESDVPTFESGLGGSNGWEGVGPHGHDAVSPISFAHRAKTPVLILHGGEDARVPPSQGRFFALALRRHDVPNELVIYPREPHGLQERNHQLDALRRTRAWFDRWIGGITLDS